MADLALLFAGDLSIGPTGDIQLADGTDVTQQRVLRRLLTNAGDYIWQLGYGAGLAQFVGQPGAPALIAGLVRNQMLQENAVAGTPAPSVKSAVAIDSSVTLTIRYTDITSKDQVSLNFSV